MTILRSSVLCTGHNILLPRILICHDSLVYIILGPAHNYYYYYLREGFKFFFFLERKFQPMAFASDNSSLSSDQDTNQFLV